MTGQVQHPTIKMAVALACLPILILGWRDFLLPLFGGFFRSRRETPGDLDVAIGAHPLLSPKSRRRGLEIGGMSDHG